MPLYGTGDPKVEVVSGDRPDGTREVWWRWVNPTYYTTGTTALEATWTQWLAPPGTNYVDFAVPSSTWATWTTTAATATATATIDRVTVPLPTPPGEHQRVARGAVRGARASGWWVDEVQYEAPTAEELERARRDLVARRDAEQARRERDNAARLAEQTRMEGAQERGMDLLLGLLTPEERAYHDTNGSLLVVGQSGRQYLIEKRSIHGNIAEVDEHGCVLGRVCVAPDMFDREAQSYLPLADGWVGQYLAIKYNEEALRTTGNWSRLGRCNRQPAPVPRPPQINVEGLGRGLEGMRQAVQQIGATARQQAIWAEARVRTPVAAHRAGQQEVA